MKPNKVPMNQTFIPVDSGRFVEPEEEYAALMGEEALERERQAAYEAYACNCGAGKAKRDRHERGCPQADKRTRMTPPSRVLPPGGIL